MTTDKRYEKLLVYGAGTLFIAANAILMLRGFYYLPLLALVPLVIYLAFFSLDKLFMAVVFLTPLSVELSRFGSGLSFDLSLPTEPLIVVIVLVVLLRIIYYGSYNTAVLYHPVSLAVMFYLLWLFITSLTSTMPLVSIKFFLVRFWFILVFYFLAIKIFQRGKNISLFIGCYIFSLFAVVIYTLYNHAGYGFDAQRVMRWVVRPFYNDHTAYAAALAMFIPLLTLFAFRGRSYAYHLLRGPARALGFKDRTKFAGYFYHVLWAILLVFITAMVFSYSRAAWLSLLAALGVWVIIRLRIGFTALVSFTLLSALLIFMLRHDIVREFEANTQDSSEDFSEHIRSITNISTDASNLERINRWNAALAMFGEKPLLGWGPGTYMFRYAPFQYSYDRTIISTNAGDGGDAHSEYLGPLAETGLPGMLSFMVVALVILLTGFRLIRQLRSKKERMMAAGVVLGLMTYLVHGVLNNFLHSDKAAVPFWGFAAILVAMDLYGKKSDSIS